MNRLTLAYLLLALIVAVVVLGLGFVLRARRRDHAMRYKGRHRRY